MNTRSLTQDEESNLEKIKAVGQGYALIFLTRTGLEKSILDAILAPKCCLLGTLLASKTVRKLC